MNVVTWNVKGLGRLAKRFLAKDFLNLHYVDVCYLQESKLEEISPAFWQEISRHHIFLHARSAAGGIIIGWNSLVLIGRLAQVGNLTMNFCFIKDNFRWRCTTVYEPNSWSPKEAFRKLRGCVNMTNVPWVICGDFNAIFTQEDKASRVPWRTLEMPTLCSKI